jgi:hypothetical protein
MKGRFDGWNRKSQCLLSIDGVHAMVTEPWPFDKAMFSHKHGRSAYNYEIGISISRGLLCWLNGPFKGSEDEKKIFAEGLANFLEEWELIECDLGFRNSDDKDDWDPKYLKLMYKGVYDTRYEGRQQGAVRARHETIQSLFKDFQCLVQVFRHGKEKHGLCFFAIGVLVQLRLLESPHWQTDYKVVYKNHPKPPEDFKTPLDESSSGESSSEESSSGDDSI